MSLVLQITIIIYIVDTSFNIKELFTYLIYHN